MNEEGVYDPFLTWLEDVAYSNRDDLVGRLASAVLASPLPPEQAIRQGVKHGKVRAALAAARQEYRWHRERQRERERRRSPYPPRGRRRG